MFILQEAMRRLTRAVVDVDSAKSAVVWGKGMDVWFLGVEEMKKKLGFRR